MYLRTYIAYYVGVTKGYVQEVVICNVLHNFTCTNSRLCISFERLFRDVLEIYAMHLTTGHIGVHCRSSSWLCVAPAAIFELHCQIASSTSVFAFNTAGPVDKTFIKSLFQSPTLRNLSGK